MSGSRRRSKGLAEWLLLQLADFRTYVSSAEDLARSEGLLQRVDPRMKVLGLLALILSVVSAKTLPAILAVFTFAVLLALGSRINLADLMRWVWRPVLFFTGCIAVPAIFMIPGNTAAQLPVLGWNVTIQGLRSAAFLIFRAEATATLSAILVFTTPWPRVLKALRVFRVPIIFVVILGSTYRYIFLLLETASDMSESRRARTVGRLEPADRRRIATASMGVLLSKSLELGGDVHLAMQSRGFRGEVYLLDDSQVDLMDWMWLSMLLGMAAVAIWMGR